LTTRLSFLAIGSELLSGHVLESNSHWLQKKLSGTEIDFVSTLCVSDGSDQIQNGLDFLIPKSDIIIICGGLGPTDDDITREVVADYCSSKLVFDDVAWTQVKRAFNKRNRAAPESNKKQAMRAQAAEVLENEMGTAPGFKIIWKNVELISFPGVPLEFKHLTKKFVLPNYPQAFSPDQFKLYGIGESDLTDLVHSAGFVPNDFEWGTIAAVDGITIKFPIVSREHPGYKEILLKFENILKEFIYTKTNLNPVELLCSILNEQNKNIATAESCTGGLLAVKITEIPGSSKLINGSIVAYQNEVKVQQLGVATDTINQFGAVSEECAFEMAKGVLNKLNANVAVSLTGIAGPTGATSGKPVGMVCMAVALEDGEGKSKTFNLSGNRAMVREKACMCAALFVLELLNND